jgi:PPOX class probable F420-dependent enzyme
MDEAEARARFGAAPVARLATIDPDGGPHLVPVTFALDGSTVVFAVDQKPKRSKDLHRLANIRGDPRVSVLVDQYADDWRALWWVRADGRARVAPDGPDRDEAVRLLVHKYPQYEASPPLGPAVLIEVHRWRWWSFEDALGS